MPVGVPGMVATDVLLDPPPQATKAAASITRNNDAKASFKRRLFTGTTSRKRQARMAAPIGTSQRGELNKGTTVDPAVVCTVITVLPGAVKEVGTNEQVLEVMVEESEQVKVTLPLKPAMELTVIVALPDAPGAEIRIGVWFEGTAKLKSGVAVMVIDTADDVEPW